MGSYHLPALPCSLLTKQEDRTPPAWAASAGDGHLQPPRLAWGEDTPVASGRPDAGGQLAESHGHMGQGNQQGRSSGGPSVGPQQLAAASGSGSDTPVSWWAWPELCDGGDPSLTVPVSERTGPCRRATRAHLGQRFQTAGAGRGRVRPPIPGTTAPSQGLRLLGTAGRAVDYRQAGPPARRPAQEHTRKTNMKRALHFK